MEDSLGLDMAPLAPQPMGDVAMRDVAPGAAPGQPTPLAVAEISEADKLGLPVELESSSDGGAPDTSALTAGGGVLVVHDGGALAPVAVKARKMLSTQWTVEMDEQLTEAVAKFGEGHWSKIAELVEGRTGKQCRERWKNQISSEVKKGDWTVEEDALIVVCVNELGTKWSEISKRFVGRTDNAIKNRYNSEVRKRERAEQRIVREAAAAEERAKNPQPENSAPPNPPRKRKSGGGGGGQRKKNEADEADLHDDIWFEADEAVTRLESREIDMLLSELNQDAGPLGLGGGGGEGDEGGGDGGDEEGHYLHQVLQSLRRARSPHALLAATKKVRVWERRPEPGHGHQPSPSTLALHPRAPPSRSTRIVSLALRRCARGRTGRSIAARRSCARPPRTPTRPAPCASRARTRSSPSCCTTTSTSCCTTTCCSTTRARARTTSRNSSRRRRGAAARSALSPRRCPAAPARRAARPRSRARARSPPHSSPAARARDARCPPRRRVDRAGRARPAPRAWRARCPRAAGARPGAGAPRLKGVRSGEASSLCPAPA